MKKSEKVPEIPAFSLREEDRPRLAAAINNGEKRIIIEQVEVALGEGSLDSSSGQLCLGSNTIDLEDTPAYWIIGRAVSRQELAQKFGERARSFSPALPVKLKKPVEKITERNLKGTLIGCVMAGTGFSNVLGIFSPLKSQSFYVLAPLNRETLTMSPRRRT